MKPSDTVVTVAPGSVLPQHGSYQFAVLSGLRAHQLMAGCLTRMPASMPSGHKATTIARMEVAAGHVIPMVRAEDLPPEVPDRPVAPVMELVD